MTEGENQVVLIENQIISRILETKDWSIVIENLLDETYFPSCREEFKFIRDHVDEYGNVPDQATFLAKFRDFELVEVTEPNEYLVNSLREEDLYRRSVPVVYKIRDLLQVDANMAAEFMMSAVKDLQPEYNIKGTDLAATAVQRYEEHIERGANPDRWYFESGFKELDDVIRGIQRTEEFFVIVARTNEGKSWVLEKMASHVWKLGFNVGYFSPEMSATTTGFRFDTLLGNFSNTGLSTGKKGGDEYRAFAEELQTHQNKFIMSSSSDFGKTVTVSKLRNWVKKYKLDLIALDGIHYITDERAHKNDNETTRLTHISEDLMALSVELGVPVLTAVQANRAGVVDPNSDALPSIEHIRDSDGIAHNATHILAIRQKDNMLFMQVQKNRGGRRGDKLRYLWDIDTGNFQYVVSDDNHRSRPNPTESKPRDRGNVF